MVLSKYSCVSLLFILFIYLADVFLKSEVEADIGSDYNETEEDKQYQAVENDGEIGDYESGSQENGKFIRFEANQRN